MCVFYSDQLKKFGFANMDALDSSQGSLDFSRSKNVYTNFICATLGPDRLPIEDGLYKKGHTVLSGLVSPKKTDSIQTRL